jgi:hypothetical protein
MKMQKFVTENYYNLDDGRKVFVKINHLENDRASWWIKKVDSEHYQPATLKEIEEIACLIKCSTQN